MASDDSWKTSCTLRRTSPNMHACGLLGRSSAISIISAQEHRAWWVSETDGSVSSQITADGEVFLASHLVDTDSQTQSHKHNPAVAVVSGTCALSNHEGCENSYYLSTVYAANANTASVYFIVVGFFIYEVF